MPASQLRSQENILKSRRSVMPFAKARPRKEHQARDGGTCGACTYVFDNSSH